MKTDKTSDPRRRKALFGLIAVAVLISLLIYFEQVVILFLLANVSLIWLLVVVALADLENVGKIEKTPVEAPVPAEENAEGAQV